jgi:hypothetical protein
MPTQRTRNAGQGAGPQQPKIPTNPRVETVPPPTIPSDPVQDLGIPDGMIDDDPGGFVPRSDVQELAGRKVRAITPDDLARAHQQYAPGTRITGERVPAPDGMRTEPIPQPYPQQDPSDAAQAQRLIPPAFRGQPQTAQVQEQTTGYQQAAPASNEKQQETIQEVTRAVSAFEYLSKMDREAKASGDPERASQTASMLGALKGQVSVQEKHAQAGRSPVLQRMVEHFGLEKIKSVDIEWGGFKWRFAPTNTRLDLWIGEKLAGNGYNAAALLVAAGTVGIDGEPIYKVLNVPLAKEYEISDLAKTITKTVTLPLYNKRCNCGNDVAIEADKCKSCGAQVDPFDLPLELRVESAERLYRFLEEKFGAYEELAELVTLKDQQMKNRVINRGELYPFLLKKPSSEAPTTNG